MHLSSDYQCRLAPFRLDQGVGEVEGVKKPAALLAEVERGNVAQAETVLDQSGDSRSHIIRCHRCRYQNVDILRPYTRVIDGGRSGFDPQVRGADSGVGKSALLYPGSGGDPIIRGVHDPRQIVVGNHVVGYVHSGAGDHTSQFLSFLHIRNAIRRRIQSRIVILLENNLTRRLITIPLVVLAFALTTFLLPILLTVALAADLIRYLIARIPATVSRTLVFVWAYLLGEVGAMVTLGFIGMLGKKQATDATYRLQRVWTDWNVNSLRLAYGLRFEVEGSTSIGMGPILVFARHASLIDSLLPARLIANGNHFRLRYVLKRELLLDPALDIAGNRLPNHFVDRGTRENEAEVGAIRQLGTAMGAADGVVIFPEGTRFSDEKLERQKERFKSKDSAMAKTVESFRFVLAPRLAGSLALLDATNCDVVVLAHHGLEGFSRAVDIWSGSLVGSTIFVALWRIPRAEIPVNRSDRADWLFDVWGDVDDWISRKANG